MTPSPRRNAQPDRPPAPGREAAVGPDEVAGLTVAVTGPTGTLGAGLLPLLAADPRIAHVTGIARRPLDPAGPGRSRLDYHQGDVRDPVALRQAFQGADVVVHLAFLVTGNATRTTIRQINIDGTVNAFRAAVRCGAQRFVYTSSVAAYGFHPDNPIGITEDWPVRPARRLFYAQEKAELERLLQTEAEANPGIEVYRLRPSIVLGPHFIGGKLPPGPLASLSRWLGAGASRLRIPVPVLMPTLSLQFVHEQDVGQALLQCVVGAGPAGAYNIAGDGIVTTLDLARELGVRPVGMPPGPVRALARYASGVPYLPPVAEWVEALSHPALMNTDRAKRELGWVPRYTGLEAVRATLRAAGPAV